MVHHMRLYNAKNLSSHDIYAKIRTKDGAELQTETCPVLYNENAIEVSKVTMINIAHGASSLDLLEYVTTFDFINPITSAQTYWYWPNYPDFTFKIDFTNNSPEIITNVALHVKTLPIISSAYPQAIIRLRIFGLQLIHSSQSIACKPERNLRLHRL